MMFKVITIFFILFQLNYSFTVETTDLRKEKLFFNWMDTKFKVNKKSAKNFKINIYEGNNENGNIFEKVTFNEKVFYIEPIEVCDVDIKNEAIIYFYSTWKKIPYLWKENNELYINGWDFLDNEKLGDVLALYLETQHKNIFIKNSKVEILYENKKIDISFLTKVLLFVLGMSVLILIFIVKKSIKKGYGNPFRR